MFPAIKANQILGMPLPATPLADLRIWRGDHSGIYSVRSGYRWLIHSCHGSSGDPNVIEENWLNDFLGSLWSLSLSPKIKIHFWRFMNNYIPTFSNLQVRQIDVSSQCVLYGSDIETVYHLAQGCPFAQQVFQGVVQISGEIVNFSRLSLQEWKYSNSALLKKVVKAKVSWSPPMIGRVKVNFDASFNQSLLQSVSGIVIRNSDGLLMAADSFPNSHVVSPEMAEALACEQALTLSKDLGFRKIEVEGDALTIISKLRHPTVDQSMFRAIYHNIYVKKYDFKFLSFDHVKRENNNAAHVLARIGRSTSTPMVWIEVGPPEVEEVICNDRW
ncbi:hypothetical protein V6N12_033378 [Hibiscus sabdariffa]|uniref:RNase H type-1 domain-containing protein n=1 Tax=Hibiscus sabdariffa TaxID=183260 RepID=A0ABR2BVC9_9ROSI